MGKETAIAWTHHTFNPWWGCEKVSPGCTNCYAEAWDKRTGGNHWRGERRFFGAKHWREPLKWNRDAKDLGVRRRVFCASMADVFELRPGDDAQAEARMRLWQTIENTPHLDWLLLTKRPEAIRSLLPAAWQQVPRDNVWLGTSVEDQERADERIPKLVSAPAYVHFLSVEPLLDFVSLLQYFSSPSHRWTPRALTNGLDWVIVGGESGTRARSCDIAWIRSIVAQCKASSVPCFVKQMGARPFETRNVCPIRLRDAKGADPSEWPADLRVQEFPT